MLHHGLGPSRSVRGQVALKWSLQQGVGAIIEAKDWASDIGPSILDLWSFNLTQAHLSALNVADFPGAVSLALGGLSALPDDTGTNIPGIQGFSTGTGAQFRSAGDEL